VPVSEDFFAQFELDRERYLNGLAQCEQRWEPSVRELIEKVDRHFELRAPGTWGGLSRMSAGISRIQANIVSATD
jgi:hypothetical protein